MRILLILLMVLVFSTPASSDTIYREGYLWDYNYTYVNLPEGVAYSVEIFYRQEREGDLKLSTKNHSAQNKIILTSGKQRRIRVMASGKGYYRMVFRKVDAIEDSPVLLSGI